VKLLLERAEGLLWGMTAAELCQCLWAAVQLQAQPSVQWGQAVNHTLPAQMQQLGPGDMCLLLWSVAGLQGRVPLQRRVQRQLLVRSQQLMAAGCFTARDLSAFLWNYWRVFGAANGPELRRQQLPLQWVVTFSKAARGALKRLTGRQLGVIMRACVLLRVIVDCMLLEEAAAVLELRSAQLSSSELAAISSSLLQLQQQHSNVTAAVVHARLEPYLVWQPALPVCPCRSAVAPASASAVQIMGQPVAAVFGASVRAQQGVATPSCCD
jgi:hypothetical protein